VDEDKLNAITESVIGCAYVVINTLGCGFLERVYENALVLELKASGHAVVQQQPLRVWYRDQIVGDYIADLIVDHLVLVELKAQRDLDNVHRAQCLNYLKATRLPICLLINFANPRLEIHRLRI
jgi:GxxExxY protein